MSQQLDTKDIAIIILCLMHYKNDDSNAMQFGRTGILQEIPNIIDKLKKLPTDK